MAKAGPSKEQKYDRQLRLWQAHGQKALEDANILVINACATATETLKNLVLPGVGSFTILDAKITSGEDAGNNFFLDRESIGKSRGECASILLNELNPDVKGSCLFDNPSKVIETNRDFFDNYSLVVAAELGQSDIIALSKICVEKSIPLMVVKSYGFVGYLRIQTNEHPIVETHPEAVLDLRLDCPFEELSQFAKSYDLPNLNNIDFAHVPYVVILLKCLDEWKEKVAFFRREKNSYSPLEHENALPQTAADRNQFKEMVRAMKRAGVDDENFEEALVAVFRACTATTIPGDVAEILKEAELRSLTSDTPSFWLLARAAADFVKATGYLPLMGALPDMKADTESFVRLQTIYRNRAQTDAMKLLNIALSYAGSVGATAPTQEETARFCKNARNLKVLRTSSIASEMSGELPSGKVAEIAALCENLDSCIGHYLCLRAVDAFYAEYMRYPGYFPEEVEADIGLLKKSCAAVLTKMGLPVGTVGDDLVHEIVRAGASELHTMASFMGGVCSQEAIKLITGQYVPLNNTFLYDGMKSVGESFNF